ncbi:MAG: T9SS type A sorting domain-containing protein, partial [Bacteroidota bacterium]
LIHTDANGIVTLDAPVDDTHELVTFPYGLEHTSDGGYMIAGSNDRSTDYFIAKVDADANLEWVNEYEVPSHNTFRPSIVKTLDGNYVAIISLWDGTESAESAESILLRKVDEQGNEIWTQNLGADKWFDERLYDYRAKPDGGLVLGGFSFPNNNGDMMLIATQADGTVSSINIQTLGQLSLSPTPSKGPLNLQFESEEMGNLNITLFNQQGQLIRQFVEQKSTNFFEQTYQLSELPAGHYFLRMELNQRSITKSWIKQ